MRVVVQKEAILTSRKWLNHWPHLLWIAAVAVMVLGLWKYSDRTQVTCANRSIPERKLKPELARIGKILDKVGATQACSVEEMVDLETMLTYFLHHATYDGPNYNDPVVVADMYGGDGPMIWFELNALLYQVRQFQKQYCGSPFEEVRRADLLASVPAYQTRVKFDLVTKPDTADFAVLLSYSLPSMLLMMGFVAVMLDRRGWKVRNLIPPEALKWVGYILSLFVSFGCAPATAMQLFKQAKKDEQQKVLVWAGQKHALSASDRPAEAKLDVFGDGRHDRQLILTVSKPVSRLVDMVCINQNRQSLTSDSKLAHFGLGLKVQLSKRLSATITTGPQYALEKGRVDSFTTFLIGSYKSPDFTVTSVNRFSRGLDGKVAPSHRHITQVRAGPMPEWLQLQWEYKRSCGVTGEDFRGVYLGIGKALRLKSRWLKGLYAFPHYDIVRNNWDVRLGWTRAFALN